ncbi:cell division regulator GpsB [Apilactobacillus micheneri]|uniref:Cell division regulator GpsB n=1 Tax=Apilactobacillus micheneri TaxID=1899430 RepID=A0ABY2YZC7_9LACO|nr:cell division regulator GpsB [Apilactobacillus micheneri]TPR25554.1 cell division regulator GpsB [Apilactobacillus micheneri]TPR26658.1 cell division regulator GpsB [Apilactobacillus micheneri]TPR28445.1 cell division regulator GpsB [Apilactobacillus micheneri]TPR29132.1 cell division regulator GpsB [Apilactobacillus micheneri]TPR30721.1 cell division regulator GpsB [Apilactobacillus micheneri]
MNNIQYTPKDILQKEFKQKMRGYDPNDVDTFLDSVIKDYQSFDKNFSDLKEENEKLKEEIKDLEGQINNQNSYQFNQRSAEFAANNPQPSNHEQVNSVEADLLKRVSNLEMRVFGSN